MKAVTTFVLAVLLVTPAAVFAQGKGKAKGDKKAPAKDSPAPAAETESRPAKTRELNFSGLDIEGKLKTPQLLYFLNRVRVELDSSTPGKRSFMKELERSADDKGL